MRLFKRKEVIIPVPMPRIDIEKGNCAMCIGDGKPSKPVYCSFNIGYHHICLCKEHFYEFMEVMMEFYEKDKRNSEAIE